MQQQQQGGTPPPPPPSGGSTGVATTTESNKTQPPTSSSGSGGLSASNPLRTIPRSASGIAAVVGPGVAIANRKTQQQQQQQQQLSPAAGVPPPPPPPPPPQPVAATVVTPPPPPPHQPQQQPIPSQPTPPNTTNTISQPSPPPPPKVIAPVPLSKPPSVSVRQTSSSVEVVGLRDASSSLPSPPPSGLEQEVDSFFLSGEKEEEEDVALRPMGLPIDLDVFTKVCVLGRRRAWADVLQVTGELLQSPSSPYHHLYNSITTSSPLDITTMLSTYTNNTASSSSSSLEHPEEEEELMKKLKKEFVDILTFRFHALLKLRRYGVLGKEVEALGLFKEKEGEEGKEVLDYGLKIMAIQTLQYTDNKSSSSQQRSIDELHKLKNHLHLQSSSSSSKKKSSTCPWVNRINHALSNAFLRLNEYRLALSSLDDVLDNIQDGVATLLKEWFEDDNDDETVVSKEDIAKVFAVFLSAARVEVLSRQGRILLQVGALQEAAFLFGCANEEILVVAEFVMENNVVGHDTSSGVKEEGESSKLEMLKGEMARLPLITQARMQIIVNEGLLYFAEKDFEKAMKMFGEALEMSSQQQLLRNKSGTMAQREEEEKKEALFLASSPLLPLVAKTIGVEADENLVSHCQNNYALCSLYSCRMHEAVSLMESLVRLNPTYFLTEVMAFNLCTLYELGSDGVTSGRKKRVVQMIAKRFYLHDIGSESFRIN